MPMSPLRRRIAERLVEAQQTAALLTTFNEIDMSAVMACARSYQEAFQERYGVKLGFMSFFVKAAIEALKLVPGSTPRSAAPTSSTGTTTTSASPSAAARAWSCRSSATPSG